MFYPDNHAHQEVMSSSSSVNHSSCQESEGERVQEREPGCGEIQHNKEKHLTLIENAEGIRLVLRNEDTAVEPNSVRDDQCQVGERQNSAQVKKEEPVVPADRGMQLGIKCLRRDSRRSERKHLKEAVPTTRRRPEEPKGSGPFFYVGGGNGATIVTAYCESRGWQRVYDKTREDYKLKWCETKSPITYYNFKDGEQLLYQIPNNKVLTTKIGLLNSLREYDRVSSKVNHGRGLRRLKMEEFFPTSFRMDIRDERDAFFAQEEAIGVNSSSTNVWICKPTGLNQGRGIFLLRSGEEIAAFRARLQSMEASQSHRKLPYRLPQARIVQRYIQNPLLLRGRKFDVRSYFLIACTKPYMVFFRHGYVRLTCDLYDPNSNNLSAHLTNQYMQKKNPLYSELKEETVWSMARLNAYVNERFRVTKGLPCDWVLGAFAKRMQQIVTQCFLAVKAKLERKLGYFDLIGCDFMIDEDFKVWLLEMNCNPALHTNCQVLKEVVPSIVTETLDLSLEIFNKRRCGLTLLPLVTQRDFVLLYNGDSGPVSDWPNRKLGPLGTPHLKNTDTQKHNLRTQKGAAVTMAEQRSEIGSTASALQVSPSFSTVEGPKPRNLVQAPKPGKTRPPPHKPARVELHLVKNWPRQSGRLEQRYSGSIRGMSTNKSRTSPTPSGRSHVTVHCQKPTGCYLNTTRFLLAKVHPSQGAWMVIQEPCLSQEGLTDETNDHSEMTVTL